MEGKTTGIGSVFSEMSTKEKKELAVFSVIGFGIGAAIAKCVISAVERSAE